MVMTSLSAPCGRTAEPDSLHSPGSSPGRSYPGAAPPHVRGPTGDAPPSTADGLATPLPMSMGRKKRRLAQNLQKPTIVNIFNSDTERGDRLRRDPVGTKPRPPSRGPGIASKKRGNPAGIRPLLEF